MSGGTTRGVKPMSLHDDLTTDEITEMLSVMLRASESESLHEFAVGVERRFGAVRIWVRAHGREGYADLRRICIDPDNTPAARDAVRAALTHAVERGVGAVFAHWVSREDAR